MKMVRNGMRVLVACAVVVAVVAVGSTARADHGFRVPPSGHCHDGGWIDVRPDRGCHDVRPVYPPSRCDRIDGGCAPRYPVYPDCGPRGCTPPPRCSSPWGCR